MNALHPYFASDDPAVERADDIDLLLRISYRESKLRDAEAAFELFFYRHAEFLRRACERLRFCHPSVPAEAVVTQVMAKVFTGEIDDFKVAPDVTNPDVVMRLIRAWLIDVAKFTFFDERKKVFSRAEIVHFEFGADTRPEPVVTPAAFQDDEPPPPTPQDRTAILALRESLGPDEQLLLDRSVDYYDPLSGDCKVPPVVARALARELGITVPAARKRRERLFARIRMELEKTKPTPLA